jgi:heme A synthase
MSINGRLFLSAMMLTLFAGMSGVALSYPPKAALLPLVVGLPGTALCVLQLALDWRGRRTAMVAPRDQRGRLRMLGWVVGFVAAVLLLGFLVAAPLALFAYARWQSREPRWLAALFGLAGFAAIYGVFELLLSVSLFEGFLIPALADLVVP